MGTATLSAAACLLKGGGGCAGRLSGFANPIVSLKLNAHNCTGYVLGASRLVPAIYTKKMNNLNLVSSLGFPSTRKFQRSLSSSSSLTEANLAEGEGEQAEPPAEKQQPFSQIKEAADVLDIRVGRVVRAWRHEEADSLYVEEVDVGEAEPRIICSGLVNYIPLHHLQAYLIIINLKNVNLTLT